MDKDKFDLLISILEDLEKEDIKNASLEKAIVKIIDQFDNHLTPDQKKAILKEFVHYEKARIEKDGDKKSMTEDEKNKQLLESFLAGEVFEWGY